MPKRGSPSSSSMPAPGRCGSCAACSRCLQAVAMDGGHALRAPGRLRTVSSWRMFAGSMPAAMADADRLARMRLCELKAVASMSRTACRCDNAPSAFGRSQAVMSAQPTKESFLRTLKVEPVHHRRWATQDEARRGLSAYTEGYYNRQRIHSALGYITPEQAQQTASQPPASVKSGEDQGARNLPQQQLSTACGDEHTKLPRGFSISRCGYISSVERLK